MDQEEFYEKNVNKYKLAKRIGIGLAILIIITTIAMIFITGFIVFSNTSQLVSNDTAYFENSMEFFKEEDLIILASLKHIMWK